MLSKRLSRRLPNLDRDGTIGIGNKANLSHPNIIAAEIVEDLQAALAQFAEIANDLKK